MAQGHQPNGFREMIRCLPDLVEELGPLEFADLKKKGLI